MKVKIIKIQQDKFLLQTEEEFDDFLLQTEEEFNHEPTIEEIMYTIELVEKNSKNIKNTFKENNHNEIFKADECPMYKDVQKYQHLNPPNSGDSGKPKN